MTALLIGSAEQEKIAALIALAEAHPVDVIELKPRLATRDGKLAHMDQMTRQTIEMPEAWLITYSIETGHSAGKCRHMSVSVSREGRAPRPDAVWMIAQEFEFWGSLEQCYVYSETLLGHGLAVNVIQPVAA